MYLCESSGSRIKLRNPTFKFLNKQNYLRYSYSHSYGIITTSIVSLCWIWVLQGAFALFYIFFSYLCPSFASWNFKIYRNSIILFVCLFDGLTYQVDKQRCKRFIYKNDLDEVSCFTSSISCVFYVQYSFTQFLFLFYLFFCLLVLLFIIRSWSIASLYTWKAILFLQLKFFAVSHYIYDYIKKRITQLSHF